MNNDKNSNSRDINDILAMLSKEYGSTEAYKNEQRDPSPSPESDMVTESYRYAAEKSNAKAPQIHTTYVPRFTEASKNYKMADDLREEEYHSNDGSGSAYPDSIPLIDPLAEIDSASDGATPVNVKRYQPEPDLETRVYKFDAPKTESAAEHTHSDSLFTEQQSYPDLPETEDFRREKAEFVKDFNADDKVETPKVEELSDKESFVVGGRRREFNIPGHDFNEGTVSGYRTAPTSYVSRSNEGPDNVGDKIDSTKKRVASEYTAYAQRDSFKDMFLDSILSVKLRFFAVLFLGLILLVGENIHLFGVDLPKLLNITGSGYMAIIDLQFIVCIYLLAIPEVIASIKNLFNGKFVPEIMFTLSFVVSLVYSLIIVMQAPKYGTYPLFGLLFCMNAAILIMASYYKKCADFMSFKVISINGEKRIVDKKFTRMLERENIALDGIVEEHKSKTARIFRTTFVSDFFKRIGFVDENTGNVLFTIVISLGVSFIAATVAYFVVGGIIAAAAAFTLVFMFSCPAFACLVHKLPYFHAMSESVTEKSVVIGETSFYDYSDVDVITFNDTEVFGPDDVNLQRVMLYGQSDNLSKALRQMSALFMNAGGPLDTLFSNSLDRKCPAASDPYIDVDGVAGTIDGHSVAAGTLEFMKRNGIRIPDEAARTNPSQSDSTKVMYGAEDGVVYVKFYIRYSFSEEFSMLLPVLQEEGIIPLVYTRDPNVTSDLINALTAGGDRIRILKKQNSPINDDPVFTRLSSGIVTLGDKMNAINMILLSKKYVRLQSGFNMIETISMVFGALLSAILAIAGMNAVPSLAIACWPLVWSLLLFGVSKKIFHIKKKKKKK